MQVKVVAEVLNHDHALDLYNTLVDRYGHVAFGPYNVKEW